MARDGLRKDFAGKLKNLSHIELEILSEGFEFYFWPRLYIQLRNTVCAVLGYDPDEDLVSEEVDKKDLFNKRAKRYEIEKAAEKFVSSNVSIRAREAKQRLEEKNEARQKVKHALNKDKKGE